jgi:hypothetical protein
MVSVPNQAGPAEKSLAMVSHKMTTGEEETVERNYTTVVSPTHEERGD